MKKFNNFIFLVCTVFSCIILFAFVIPQDQKTGGPWEIPAKYKSMKNTYAQDKSLTKVGKMLYAKHCKSCHGSDGLGDGSKAAQLDTYPGDFTSDDYKAGSDGEKYYKAIVGRSEMPNFEKKIVDDEDRWAIINFISALE